MGAATRQSVSGLPVVPENSRSRRTQSYTFGYIQIDGPAPKIEGAIKTYSGDAVGGTFGHGIASTTVALVNQNRKVSHIMESERRRSYAETVSGTANPAARFTSAYSS